MKKFLSFILVFLCILGLIAFPVSAENETAVGKYPSYITVDISKDEPYGNDSYYKNMVRNPYYQKYYNELLEYSYQVYTKLFGGEADKSYIESFSNQYIKNPENYITLIFAKHSDTNIGIKEYNIGILEKYFDAEDILYVSDYSPAAVVCIEAENSDIVNQISELEFIGDAFFTNGESILMPTVGTYTLGNVLTNGNEMGDLSDVTAADARFLLRYTAGLEEVGPEKNFYFCADMNFDNKIDAADARLALRTSAGLENVYYISFNYFQFWNDMMGVIVK